MLIKEIEKYNFTVGFLSDRQMLQFRSHDDLWNDGAHVDVWLWNRKHINDENQDNDEKEMNEEVILRNGDYSLKYQNRLISHIYPLKISKWLDVNVSIPFDSHTISYKEYGESYMNAKVYRKNCFHNLIYGRWMR